MKAFIKGVDKLNSLVTWAVVLLTATMCIVIFAQVFFRYVLDSSLSWSEEVARYMMVWATFLGAALGVRKKSLLGMEFVMNIMPKLPRRIIQDAVTFLQLIFLAVVLYFGVEMLSIVADQTSAALEISMAVAYAGIPVGTFFMFLNTIVNFIEHKTGLDEHDQFVGGAN